MKIFETLITPEKSQKKETRRLKFTILMKSLLPIKSQ